MSDISTSYVFQCNWWNPAVIRMFSEGSQEKLQEKRSAPVNQLSINNQNNEMNSIRVKPERLCVEAGPQTLYVWILLDLLFSMFFFIDQAKSKPILDKTVSVVPKTEENQKQSAETWRTDIKWHNSSPSSSAWNHQLSFISSALYTVLIVLKQLYCHKQENNRISDAYKTHSDSSIQQLYRRVQWVKHKCFHHHSALGNREQSTWIKASWFNPEVPECNADDEDMPTGR